MSKETFSTNNRPDVMEHLKDYVYDTNEVFLAFLSEIKNILALEEDFSVIDLFNQTKPDNPWHPLSAKIEESKLTKDFLLQIKFKGSLNEFLLHFFGDYISTELNSENPSKTKPLSDIQQENTIWRKNVSWAKDYPPNATTHRENINTVQYGTPDKLATDTTKVGEITSIDQETPANLEQFFQNTTPTIIDPSKDSKFKDLFQDSKGKPRTPKRHEVFQRVIEVYKKDYYIPGIDYQNWLMANSTHVNTKPLKNNQYNYFPSSLFRYVNGSLNVPCLRWGSSGWSPYGYWLAYVWHQNGRVALLSR